MTEYYEYELGKAAKILIDELVKVKPGEVVAITADTGSDRRVVSATAAAAFAAGAREFGKETGQEIATSTKCSNLARQ